MSNITKKRIERFQPYDHDGIKAHLTKMANKGWKLKKINNLFWIYESITPQPLVYDIVLLDKKSLMDKEFTDGQIEFIDYCNHAGWDYVTQQNQMQIFVAIKENITPIETDQKLKLALIHKTMMKTQSIATIFVLVISFLFILMQTAKNTLEFFLDGISIVLVPYFIILSFMVLFYLVEYICWYAKSKKQIEEGLPLPKTNTHPFYHTYIETFFWLLILMGIVFTYGSLSVSVGVNPLLLFGPPIMIVIGIPVVVKRMLKKSTQSTKKKWGIVIVTSVVTTVIAASTLCFLMFQGFENGSIKKEYVDIYTQKYANGDTYDKKIYNDPVPLTIQDMGVDGDYRYSYESDEDSTIFLTQTRYSQETYESGTPNLDLAYTIIDVHFTPLFDPVLDDLLTQYDRYNDEYSRTYYESISHIPWGADQVYQCHQLESLSEVSIVAQNKYIIAKGNRLLAIQLDEEPTTDQIKIIMDKLFYTESK